MQWDCRLSTGLPPSSWLCQLWSRKEDLQRAWNQERKAVWDQVGLSHCQHDGGLVAVRDEACLRRGHIGQSCRGHQCSETTLTGESRFHVSTPLGIEPRSLMTGSTQVDHWTSGTVYECSEIAGSPHYRIFQWYIFGGEIVLPVVRPRHGWKIKWALSMVSGSQVCIFLNF